MASGLGPRGVLRRVAWLVARGHVLDLADGLALGGLDPCGLGLRRGDPAELAHGREVEPSGGERSVELGQLGEDRGHPQAFLGLP